MTATTTTPPSLLISGQEGYREKGRFLYGESMGGVVALLLHKKDPSFWNGAILVAPMCKIHQIKDPSFWNGAILEEVLQCRNEIHKFKIKNLVVLVLCLGVLAFVIIYHIMFHKANGNTFAIGNM